MNESSQSEPVMMNDIKFIEGSLGNEMLICKKHAYHLRKNYKSGKRNFVCKMTHKTKCRASITMDANDKLYSSHNEHNHEPEDRVEEKIIFSTQVKYLSRSTDLSPDQIIDEALRRSNLGKENLNVQRSSIKRSIRRKKIGNKKDNFPRNVERSKEQSFSQTLKNMKTE
ncbi:hypothetical protein SNEBB_007049 [Seison nebaliae]|nr:hypothetical protein SNEBB_007049 [Seison nebaliae]